MNSDKRGKRLGRPRASNHKIERTGVNLMQLAGTRAEIGDGQLFKNVHHSVV